MVQEQLFLDEEVKEENANQGDGEFGGYATLKERIKAERLNKSQAQPRSLRNIGRNPDSLNFDLTVQRNLRWTDFQVSELIESFLLGYPVPPVYAVKSNDDVTWCIDGKQRFKRAIIPFMNDQIAFTEDFRPIFGVEVAGKKFSELPIEFQEILEECNVNVYQYDKLTPDQIDEMFRRLNSGTSLSSIELIRSILGTENLDYINSLIDTPFIQMTGITDKQREGFKDQEMVLQMIAVITGRHYDIGSKALREIALDLRINGLSDDERSLITATFSFLGQAFSEIDEKTRKKVMKKADIIGLAGAAVASTDRPEVFGDVLAAFIKVQSPGSMYGKTKSNKTASADSVKTRIQILQGALAIGKKDEKTV
nr:DUF262 domain-containing protein [Mycobacterium sp. E3298]